MLRELRYYFGSNKLVTLSLYIQITLILLILGSFFYFSKYLNAENYLLKEKYDNKSMFQLTHNYHGIKGEEFFNNPNSLKIVKSFYNSLNKNNNFDFLSISDQFIYISEKKIEDIFLQNYEMGDPAVSYKLDDKEYKPVKSIQINKQTADYFNITSTNNTIFTEDNFRELNNNKIPIMLGDTYNSIYKIGDVFEIEYMGKFLDAKVIGFLPKGFAMLTDGNFNQNLDRFIIMPHVDYKEVSKNDNKDEFDTLMTIYMRRISSIILTQDNKNSINKMREDVENLAQRINFNEYLFYGENMHINEYKSILSMIKENTLLITSILIFICIIGTSIISIILILQNNSRKSYYSLRFMLGSSKSTLILQQWVEIALVILSSYITYLLISIVFLSLIDILINTVMLFVLIIYSLIITYITTKNKFNNSSILSLNSEVGGI